MGLFSKKAKATETIQLELQAMQERLVAAERAKADLEDRIRVLDDAHQTLLGRITSLDESTAQVDRGVTSLSSRLTAVGDQVSVLSASNNLLTDRVEAVDGLEQRLRDLTERLERPMSTPPPPPPADTTAPPPPMAGAPVPDERLADLAARIDQLAADGSETTELREQLAVLTDRMTAMDERVTSVSTELANQLTELSQDIDDLHRQQAAARAGADDTSDAPVVAVDTAELEARLAERLDAAMDDVLDATERLAAEQARYEIQFRADLAELADRLRRPRP